MTQTDDCILCRIATGTLPARKIYEDPEFLGILDVTPCAEGHCLVVPKAHVVRFYDLDEATLGRLFGVVRVVAQKIKQTLQPDFVCVFIRGGRIAHLHVAVFPSQQNDALSGFPQSNLGAAAVDLDAVQAKLTLLEE